MLSQQRAHEADAEALKPGWHTGQARHTGAAAERQQQGFNLIVGMLREGDGGNSKRQRLVGQRPIADFAGSVFRTFAAGVFGLHLHHMQRNTDGGASRLAMSHEIISRRLQPVMNMNGNYTPGELRCGGMQ